MRLLTDFQVVIKEFFSLFKFCIKGNFIMTKQRILA